jgi:hypothetical protein
MCCIPVEKYAVIPTFVENEYQQVHSGDLNRTEGF